MATQDSLFEKSEIFQSASLREEHLAIVWVIVIGVGVTVASNGLHSSPKSVLFADFEKLSIEIAAVFAAINWGTAGLEQLLGKLEITVTASFGCPHGFHSKESLVFTPFGIREAVEFFYFEVLFLDVGRFSLGVIGITETLLLQFGLKPF